MEKREPGIDSDGIIMQQYPSPTADAHDIGYYAPHSRDHHVQPIDPSMEQQSDPQEPQTPQQHGRRTSVSAEELQLAAQLSQGLAPMMEAGQHHEHEASQDANLANHDPSLHNQDASLHGQDPALQNQDGASLHGVMPPQAEPGQHQYMSAPPAPPHLPPHLQMAQMAQQAYAAVDSTPPRKRSKVSRACDECRRKKVKCDAVSETGDEQCTNCRKAQIACLFSRVPQKRGPSKGYIKELADRIHSIEGKLGNQALSAEALDLAGAPRRESTDDYSPAAPLNENAKRPFSSISGDALSTPATNRLAGWASEPRPPHSYQTPSSHRSSYGPAKLAPRPVGPPTQTAADRVDGLPAETHAEPIREIDDGLYDGYLTYIHQALPLLPDTKSRAEDELRECPQLLGQAFTEALLATVQPFQSPATAPTADARAANRLLLDWQIESAHRSRLTDLFHLRTLLLLAIEAENHGPDSISGEHGSGESKTSFLARAVAIAYKMGLHSSQASVPDDGGQSAEANDRQATMRAWWSLVALDRWNAIGTCEPLLISEDTVVSSPDLKLLLGEGGHLFIELTLIMGSWDPTLLLLRSPAPTAAGASTAFALGTMIGRSFDGWLQLLPSAVTSSSHPIIYLAYWHCKLLGYLLMPQGLSTDVLWAAKETVQLLASHPQLLTPLNHYFSCLAGLCLAELTKVDATRDEAKAAVGELLDGSFALPSWDIHTRAKLNEKLRPSTSGVEATASQSLQHLADLAAAAGLPSSGVKQEKTDTARRLRNSRNYEDMGFDPRPMLRGGYLNGVRASS